MTFHDDYTRIAAALAARGVRPPCLIQGVQYIPIAFYAGCASAGTAAPGEHVALLIQAGQPAAGVRQELARLPHHRHHGSQGQRLYPVTDSRSHAFARPSLEGR